MSPWPLFNIADGTEQDDRFSRALVDPRYFRPDERRFEDLLALGIDLAKFLPFRDLTNKLKGTWEELFRGNEIAVMALILSKDTERLDAEFRECMEMGLEKALPYVYAIALDVNDWLNSLDKSESEAASELSERIAVLVRERFIPVLRAQPKIVELLQGESPLSDGAKFGAFHPAWDIERVKKEADREKNKAEQDWGSLPLRDETRRIFAAFLNVVAHLQSLVRPYLRESLGSREHEPALALFVVFVALLKRTRYRLNKFTDRHLDFYYRDVLTEKERQHKPDHLFFALEPVEGQSEVKVPAGTAFLTKAQVGSPEIVFASTEATVVTDAKVAALCTLRFQRDRLISPESELGHVTRIRSLEHEVSGEDAQSGSGTTAESAWPLFGAGPRLATDQSEKNARIGFLVSSPVLVLREGRRIIEIQVELVDPDGSSRLENQVQQQVQDVNSVAEFHRVIGSIVRRKLLTAGEYLGVAGHCEDALVDDPKLKELIDDKAERLLDREGHEAVVKLLARGRQEVFQTLLKDVFDISLTIPSGWHKVDSYAIGSLNGLGKGARSGLRFRLHLGPEVDPIVSYSPDVHGGGWGGSSPLIRFELNTAAHFFAYSLLNASPLSAVAIDVHVQGLRNLRLYNNVGRIDGSKPFQPFGPAPTLSSFFAFGSYEMAQKRLTGLTLELEWAELPTCFGGFDAHYADYGRGYNGSDFQVDLSVLQDGTFQPQDEVQRPLTSLFKTTGPAGKLVNRKSIKVDLLDAYRPAHRQVAEDEFDLQSGARNGFFRLGLRAPQGAFGHAEYPMLLTKALSENIRSKVFGKVPNAPYTPVLSQVQVDYRAQERMSMEETGPAERADREQRIFHLQPFGYEELSPMSRAEAFTLLPKYDTDGNLFIGISGHDLRFVSLVFQLAEKANQQTPYESPDLVWYCLTARGWRRLPASSFVSDTTEGLLTSGVVKLMLPDDLDTQSTLMPSGKGWLRVGTNAYLDAFPRLIRVRANGLSATRRIDSAAGETISRHLPTGCEWRTVASIPGLSAITQVGGSFGGEPTETRRRFVTRVSERLGHKNRAISAWDYERLILQRFPTLFKVKCFAGLCASEAKPRPGNILVVVVPHAVQGEALEHQQPMVDVLELRRIQGFILQVSSPFVTVEVRNPLYERIQVRCKVKLRDDRNPESYIRRLDHEVSEFLSPWVPTGYRARFGWIIRREQVEGFIRELDYVVSVTDFSMLHITEDDPDTYTLADTARQGSKEKGGAGCNDAAQDTDSRRHHQVRWRYPWSLAVPMERHFIHAIREEVREKPEPVGIDELAIGRTFIINGNEQP